MNKVEAKLARSAIRDAQLVLPYQVNQPYPVPWSAPYVVEVRPPPCLRPTDRIRSHLHLPCQMAQTPQRLPLCYCLIRNQWSRVRVDAVVTSIEGKHSRKNKHELVSAFHWVCDDRRLGFGTNTMRTYLVCPVTHLNCSGHLEFGWK